MTTHYNRLRKLLILRPGAVIALFALLVAGCGAGQEQQDQTTSVGSSTAPSGAEQPEEPDVVSIAVAAFQDVMAIYVGIEAGIFEENGIELDITRTEWGSANELMVGGQVEIANTSDADIILQNNQGADTTMAFPFYFFAGGGLMYDPERFEWTTYDSFLSQTDGDVDEAIRLTLEQMAGTRVGSSTAAAGFATFAQMVDIAGMSMDDFEIIDLGQDELPPAALSNSIDVMIGGIPQRLAVQREGFVSLIDQTAVPSTVVHAGFGARRTWVQENMDLARRFQQSLFQIVAYVNENPGPSFDIISDNLEQSGTEVPADEIAAVWNTMEFFVASPQEFLETVASPDGLFHWRDRFGTVISNFEAEGTISEFNVSLDDLYFGEEIVRSIGG